MKALAELSTYLASWLRELRPARQHAVVLECETLVEIVAEGRGEAAALGATAHRARIADDEAGILLDAILADGVVTPAELSALRRARRHISRSATLDHDLSERLIP